MEATRRTDEVGADQCVEDATKPRGVGRNHMVSLHKKTIYETLGRESVHPFPARMAPGIALAVIAKAKRPLRVLDPMMGSGTVIALARFKKHKAIGLDID